ncbi:MAG: sigma-70 family RNA polymerase sigma factor [Chloroflexota bacterium]|nr:MAG: sigma-70 family RNA polymerase sigma factor [Chloroflexota bacterium]
MLQLLGDQGYGKAAAVLTDEAALVEAARTSAEAFGELYDRYFDRIYRYAYRKTNSREEAEDITSLTFQRALEGLGRYEWRSLPFGAWLYRIASNAIIDRHRRWAPTVPVDDLDEGGDLPLTKVQPDELIERVEAHQELVAALRQLSTDQREVLILRFSENLRFKEIGVIMGRSEGAVKKLLYRALLALRGHLESLGGGNGIDGFSRALSRATSSCS